MWNTAILKDYDYVAVMTGRCPNLMEIKCQKDSVFNKPLTENGLLMQVGEIAESYKQSGHFPRIALLDDIVVHGRSLNLFLQQFLELLAACLNTDDLESLYNKLCKSLSLFVLIVNDAPILLKQEYQWGMQFERIGREREWRDISYKISEDIYKSDVANTSHVISAKQQEPGATIPVSDSWELVDEDAVSYRRTSQRLYVHVLSIRNNAYPTVRSYICGGHRYYTPFFFCGTLSDEQLERLFDEIAVWLDEESRGLFRPFLDIVESAKQYDQLRPVYFQLVNLLLGQITLSRFIEDTGLSMQDFQLDTKKISYNFGHAKQTESALKALCSIHWPEDILDRVCVVLEIPGQALSNAPPLDSPEDICNTIKLFVYLQAVRHEAYAKSLERDFAAGRGTSKIRLTGEVEFESFLSIILSALSASVQNHKTALLVLSCLSRMIDCGDVYIKPRAYFDENGGCYIYESCIRNTELSLAIMPRDLGAYFPTFVRMTQLYQLDEGFPGLVAKHFTRILPPDSSESKDILFTAKVLAKILTDYSSMSDSLLEWNQELLKNNDTF